MKIVSLDVGGTNIRSAIVERTKLIDYKKTLMPRKQREAINKIFEIIESYGKADAICVSTAGFERGGVIVNSPNNDMEGAPLSKMLKRRFKNAKVFLENDAKCACIAEKYYGRGKGKKNFVLLTLGTGIGVSLFFRGEIIHSEAGHMYIEEGEFEKFASGKAVQNLAKKYNLLNFSNEQIVHLAKNGNKNAIFLFNEIGENLAQGIINISLLINPEIIILSGGFSKVDLYFESMKKTIEKQKYLLRKISVVKSKFGERAGLIGAAMLPDIEKNNN